MPRRSSAIASRAALLVVSLVAHAASGCGGTDIPARGVIETNVGDWEFRRYQRVLDVEVWIPGNPAVAHTASYVFRDAARRGDVARSDVVSAFVTRYEHDRDIEDAVAAFSRRLASEPGYSVEVGEVSGGRAAYIRGTGEAWVLWASEVHVVKLGGRGRDEVPGNLVGAYAEHYPSTLDDHALAR